MRSCTKNHQTVWNRQMVNIAILLRHVFLLGLELDLYSISSTSVFKYELETKHLECMPGFASEGLYDLGRAL